MIKKSILGLFFIVLAYYFNTNTRVKIKGKLVNTKTGVVRGVISHSREGRPFYEWLGVPYAKPPVGELRFESPQPVEKWEGVRDASEYGTVCAHFDAILLRHLGEEDCLFLNIHVPKDRPEGALLPVMFWIHGGYFSTGSSNIYRPDFLLDHDVILVTSNYRLGAFGFLNTGDGTIRGNMGLKDQNLALKWVNENIEFFGGDPSRITIFGESAGGASVHFHVLSPMSKGLFSKAIAQSGVTFNHWAIYDYPAEQAKQYAQKIKCPTESVAAMVECLKSMDASEIVEAHREIDINNVVGRSKSIMVVPTVEMRNDSDTFLPAHPEAIVKSGVFNKVPLFLGVNAHEGLLFTQALYKNESLQQDIRYNWEWIDQSFLFLTVDEEKHSQKIREFYIGTDGDFDFFEKFPALTDLMTDRSFYQGINKAAILHSQHAPTYFYYYSKPSTLSLVNIFLMLKGTLPPMLDILIGVISRLFRTKVLGHTPEILGSCHSDELFQLFPLAFAEIVTQEHPDYEFSKDLVKTFVEFASSDDAPSFRGQKFPEVAPNDVKVVELHDGPPEVKELPNKERLKFWDSLSK